MTSDNPANPGYQINITGNNYGAVNVGGTTHGPMSGATVHQTSAELLTLLDRLRAEQAGQQDIERHLEGLAEDVRAARAGEAVEPAAVLSRWERVKGLLTQVSQAGEPVVRISEQLNQLFGPG
ncbi:hypothetical protein [Amycolatopsis cihanbeyliensis]|uniref:Uncharacterized protein n=1 Tax=Amycolatopsis cihanbeyliensis TaxID=1128664 RepID=A0A542DQK0_AMYCI|nr:hypothetical protein [Amycolatopsis cihanbeyliensis]TQJ05379.1 hypothetical protein FB471_5208 [Amycolatopsis cihanbeyliensis]